MVLTVTLKMEAWKLDCLNIRHVHVIESEHTCKTTTYIQLGMYNNKALKKARTTSASNPTISRPIKLRASIRVYSNKTESSPHS